MNKLMSEIAEWIERELPGATFTRIPSWYVWLSRLLPPDAYAEYMRAIAADDEAAMDRILDENPFSHEDVIKAMREFI